MTRIGHNGGPPLEDEHVPEWGRTGTAHVYFAWKRAHDEVWRNVPWDAMLRRQRRAEAIGLTYEEYTLELLERGRYLGPADRERIEAIKAARAPLALLPGGARPPAEPAPAAAAPSLEPRGRGRLDPRLTLRRARRP